MAAVCLLYFQIPSGGQSLLKTRYFNETYYETYLDHFHENATSLLVDSYGYIWVGTYYGLFRYDGVNFEQIYRFDKFNEFSSSPGQFRQVLTEDASGNIWGNHSSGIFRVNRKNEKVHVSAFPDSTFRFRPTDIKVDGQNNFWFTSGFQVGRIQFPGDDQLEGANVQYYVHRAHSPAELYILSMALGQNNKIWVGSTLGLFQDVSPMNGPIEFEQVNLTESPQTTTVVNAITPAKDNQLVVYGHEPNKGGDEVDFIRFIDVNSHAVTRTTFESKPKIPKKITYDANSGTLWILDKLGSRPLYWHPSSDPPVNSLRLRPDALDLAGSRPFTDKITDMIFEPFSGNLWLIENYRGLRKISTMNHGLAYVPIISEKGVSADYNKQLAGRSVIAQNNFGDIFLSTEKNYVFKVDPRKDHTETIETPVNPDGGYLEHHNQWKQIFGSGSKLWFCQGTTVGQIDRKGIISNTSDAKSVFPDLEKRIYFEGIWNNKAWFKSWVGRTPKRFAFDMDSQTFDSTMVIEVNAYNPSALTSDGEFVLLLGTTDGVLLVKAPVDSLVVHGYDWLAKYKNKNIMIPNCWPLSISVSGSNDAYISTIDRGILHVDVSTRVVSTYDRGHGLKSNEITTMVTTSRGDLLVGSNAGLSLFDSKKQTFYTPEALEPIKYVSELFEDRKGYIWVASPTPPSLYVFHPDSLNRNPFPPRTLITELFLDDEPVSISDSSVLKQSLLFTDEISLDHYKNNIAFGYRGMHFEKPEENQYAYQLRPVHKDWVMADKVKIARFADLSPGDYIFSVKSSNSHGLWGDPTELAFTIHPPWYWSAMAKTTYLLLLFGLLYTIYRWRVQSIRAENLKLEALVQERTLQLEQQAKQLKELDQAKTRFFANISHEFRTPLTLILGPLKKMYQGNFSGDHKSIYGVMIRNAQRLLRLINQLLDISKLEAGKMELKAAKGDLVHFMQLITANYTSLAAGKQIKYQFYHRQDTLEVWFDPDKMEKIMTNLLSNAFKFTPNGGEVTVYLGQQDDQAEIEVKDTGIGIPQEDLDKIFDRFHQVDATQTREQEGTGIGMTLVKELVELHQGTITVKSEVEKGTTFTLLFPLGKDHLLPGEIVEEAPELALELEDPEVVEVLRAAARDDAAVEESDHPHILIAEDNPDMRTYIREALEGQFDLSEAQDGQEGWEKAQESQPDLIISDVMMPRMDGIELCEKLKTHELTSHIPVILLTAKADRSSRLQGLETGADDYLAKPFDEEELLVLISNRIEQRRRMRERFKSNIHIGPKEVSVTSADQQFLEKAMAIVEENMSNDAFSVDDLAQEVGMSNRQLQRKFNALVDQSPNQFIRTMRLRRAAQLLTANSDSVSQIAYQVGFSSLSYFNKAFKEEFDMTPGEYAEKGDSISR